jgi:hypothetical protein
MFMAFVGLIDNELTDLCIRGNGKTCAEVFYLFLYYLAGYEVWTNYYTTFSTHIIGFQEMVDKLRELRKRGDNRKIVLGVTEMQDLINSVGTQQEQLLYVDSFTNQMRKLECDCLYDTQIFKNVNIRLRRHTENIRVPLKFHLDNKPCNFDRCEKKHFIDVHSYKPWKTERVRRLKAWEVGKMYNSKEMVIDQLILEKAQKNHKKKEVQAIDEIIEDDLKEPEFSFL